LTTRSAIREALPTSAPTTVRELPTQQRSRRGSFRLRQG
jgi:hypothetical protein